MLAVALQRWTMQQSKTSPVAYMHKEGIEDGFRRVDVTRNA